MFKINPYLTFNGQTEEAFEFYKSVFGGEFQSLSRFRDMPESDQLSDEDKEKVMHVSLPLGNDCILMASDKLDGMGQELVVGNNFSISIQPDNKQEADKLFAGLSSGGRVDMPLEDTFWGAYFGMLTDKFGIQWMINVDQNEA